MSTIPLDLETDDVVLSPPDLSATQRIALAQTIGLPRR